jgi:hypothetical protein
LILVSLRHPPLQLLLPALDDRTAAVLLDRRFIAACGPAAQLLLHPASSDSTAPLLLLLPAARLC